MGRVEHEGHALLGARADLERRRRPENRRPPSCNRASPDGALLHATETAICCRRVQH